MGTTAIKKPDFVYASYEQIYDPEAVLFALRELNEKDSAELGSVYRKMLQTDGLRFSVKPAGSYVIDDAVVAMPNFAAPLSAVRKQIKLCSDTDDRLEIMPILLLGDPGVGKTHFAKQLADCIGTKSEYVSLSSLSAGWVLSGSSSSWKGSKPGKVFETLVNGRYSNPVIVLDEVDKASGNATYDPLGALYALLENETARTFVDEFADIPVNASQIIWIATANDERSIPAPILSRMSVYEIAAPDRDAARSIAQSIYSGIRNAHRWGQRFAVLMDDDTLDTLARVSPRDMRKALLSGFGNAREDGRGTIKPDDVKIESRVGRAPIGF